MIPMMEDASLLLLCVICSALSKLLALKELFIFCSTARTAVAWWLHTVAHGCTSATGEIRWLHTPMGVHKISFNVKYYGV